MSWFSKEESFLGIDIGAGGMKLVELKKVKGRPQLWTYGMVNEVMDIHPLPMHEKTAQELSVESQGKNASDKKNEAALIDLSDPRIERYGGYLKQLLSATKAVSRRASASLPVSHIFHAVVTLPKGEEKNLAHDVLAKVAKILPLPIEQMQVVHQIIPSDLPPGEQRDVKALVTAAPKDLVAFYSAIFQRAGLKLEALETEAFALERSLVGRDTATVMVVDVGAERTNFFIMDHGLPITHRTIAVGGGDIDQILSKTLGVDIQDVGQVKHDLSVGQLPVSDDLFLAILDPIVKEIQYGFELYLSQSGNQAKKPEKIIFTGGASLFPPIVPYVSRITGMKTFVGDPWARVVYQDSLRRVIDPIGPRMAVAIGLAMRQLI